MSAKNAQRSADDFVSRLKLPDPAGTGKFQLVTFDTDEDCRFFYPRRALDWQRQVNTYVGRILRRRGIRVRRVAISPNDYFAWRGERNDSQELRHEFADQHVRLLNEDL